MNKVHHDGFHTWDTSRFSRALNACMTTTFIISDCDVRIFVVSTKIKPSSPLF